MIEEKCFSTSTEREKWILFLYHAHEHPVACSFFIFLNYLRQSLPLCEGELNQERRSELAAWHRAEEGRAAGCRGSLCLDLLGLLGPQPAFLGFFFTLWMSWCLKTENITSGRCDFSYKADAGVGTGQCVQLGAVLWPWTCWETNGLREIVTGNLEDVSPKLAWDVFCTFASIFWSLANIFLYAVSSWLSAGVLNVVWTWFQMIHSKRTKHSHCWSQWGRSLSQECRDKEAFSGSNKINSICDLYTKCRHTYDLQNQNFTCNCLYLNRADVGWRINASLSV